MKKQLEATKQQVTTLKSDYKTLLTGEVVTSADLALHFGFAERQKATSSLTMPTQHATISMHSLHPPHSQHRSQHQQQPHSSHAHHHRGDMDDRGFMPHPQQRSPSHNPVHSSPKRSSHYPTQPGGDTFHPTSHMYQRRRSNEESPDLRKIADHISEHRRMSADHAGRDHSSRASADHAGHDHSLRASADHAGRDHGSRVSGNGRTQGLKQQEQSHAYSHKHSGKTGHNFVETSTNETKFSQYWGEEGSGADIAITLEDGAAGEKGKSSSTLIEEDTTTPQHLKTIPLCKQDLSQEPFGEEEMLSLAEAPEPVPNHYYDSASYFGEHQENYPLPKITGQSLSQSSPPKSHHRKSLTDLTVSSISLTSQQFLSQSAIAIHDLHRYGNSGAENRQRSRMPSHKHLPQMSSDTHLNKSHIPGLKSSVISALSEVREEVRKQQKQSQTSHPRTLNSQHSHRPVQAQQRTPQHRSSHLQQKHLKATEVKGSGGGRKLTSDKRYIYL